MDFFLETDVIGLSAFCLDSISDNYISWFNNGVVCKGNSHHKFPYTHNLAIDYLESVKKNKDLVFAIIFKESQNHIGNISLQNINWINRSAELALLIGETAYWAKGIGIAASNLLITHAFNELNLNRIFSGTLENNIGFIKLAKRIGMTEIGQMRSAVYKNGEYFNLIMFDILRDEFMKKANNG